MRKRSLPIKQTVIPDGIHGMVPCDQMSPAARKLRDAYARVSGAFRYAGAWGVCERMSG
jgi:hypothetical protein